MKLELSEWSLTVGAGFMRMSLLVGAHSLRQDGMPNLSAEGWSFVLPQLNMPDSNDSPLEPFPIGRSEGKVSCCGESKFQGARGGVRGRTMVGMKIKLKKT